MSGSISFVAMLDNASWPVLTILVVLCFLSVLSWVIIIQKHRFLNNAQKYFNEFEEQFWSGIDLGKLYQGLKTHHNPDSGIEHVFNSGFTEFIRFKSSNAPEVNTIIKAAQRAMRVSVVHEEKKLNLHLPFLASVGTLSPYVGLLGTVLGIMNSFFGLMNIQQPTLAVVAPGIAEALMTTALGLIVAIPAALFYNRFLTTVDELTTNYQTFSEEFFNILDRKLHRINSKSDMPS